MFTTIRQFIYPFIFDNLATLLHSLELELFACVIMRKNDELFCYTIPDEVYSLLNFNNDVLN